MNGIPLLRVIATVSGIIAFLLNIGGMVSKEWISFQMVIQSSEVTEAPDKPSVFQTTDVTLGLWKVKLCYSTSVESDITLKQCNETDVKAVLDVIDVLELDQKHRSNWEEAVSMLLTCRAIIVVGCILLFAGVIALFSTLVDHETSGYRRLKSMCTAILFYVAAVVLLIVLIWHTWCVRTLTHDIIPVKSHFHQVVQNAYCRIQFAVIPMAIVLEGISAFLCAALAVSFTVLTLQSRPQPTPSADDLDLDIPEDLQLIGPVISCDNSDIDLEKLLNKARQG